MSTSYNAGVVLGVKLSELGYFAKLKSEKFQVHDKKGKPTGKFENDYSWEITFNGKTDIEAGETFYIENIEDRLNMKKPIEIVNVNYYDDGVDIEKFVIGVVLSENNYDEYFCLKEIDIVNKLGEVKAEFNKQFGIDNINLKLYFYFKVS